MLQVYKKIHRFLDVLNYFSTKEVIFSNDRFHELIDSLDYKDRQLFPSDMRDFVWDSYCQNYFRGLRIYLLKDPLETVPKAKIRFNR